MLTDVEGQKTSYTETHLETIAQKYFSPDVCPVPRAGYTYGDNPFAKYLDPKGFVRGRKVGFVPILGRPLTKDDFCQDSWLRFRTYSDGNEATYTLHVMKDPDETEEITVVGCREQQDRRTLYLAGRLKIPQSDEEAVFTEAATAYAIDELRQARYISPDEIMRRIKAKIMDFYGQFGDAWMGMSISGMENAPRGVEIHELPTTRLKNLIEIGVA